MLLDTEHLTVRRYRESDAPALHALLSDPEVMRCLEPPYSRDQTERFLRQAGLCDPPLVYAVTRKRDGALIGQLIWHPWDENAMELGWLLRRDQWGKGFAGELTEAALTLTRRDVVLECCPEQRATRHIARRYGFVLADERDGLLVYRRQGK